MTATPRRSALLRSELLKARSSPATYGFIAAIAALTALNTGLALSDTQVDAATDAGVRHAFSAGRDFLVLFTALGAAAAAGEFRHSTITATLLASPSRGRVLTAKIAAYVALGAMGALIASMIQGAIALPWVETQGNGTVPWSDVLSTIAGNITAAAAATGIGVGIGMLVRNQVVALIAAFGWFTVAENVLGLLEPGVSRFLPGGAFTGLDQDTAHLLPGPVAALVVTGWLLAIGLVASRTTLRRDIA